MFSQMSFNWFVMNINSLKKDFHSVQYRVLLNPIGPFCILNISDTTRLIFAQIIQNTN